MATGPDPLILGTWTAPSGARIAITARVRIDLTLRSAPGNDRALIPDDRRWLLEEVLPQLHAPLQDLIAAQVNAAAVRWLPPDDDEAPG
jgi:hypothetical protein